MLADRINNMNVCQVYLTEYHDPTTDAQGQIPINVTPDLPLVLGVDQEEGTWAHDVYVPALNDEVHLAAQRHGWQIVDGIDEAFQGHGYSAEDERWVLTATDSVNKQGPVLDPVLVTAARVAFDVAVANVGAAGGSLAGGAAGIIIGGTIGGPPGGVLGGVIGSGIGATVGGVAGAVAADVFFSTFILHWNQIQTKGTLHPNAEGHEEIAKKLLAAMPDPSGFCGPFTVTAPTPPPTPMPLPYSIAPNGEHGLGRQLTVRQSPYHQDYLEFLVDNTTVFARRMDEVASLNIDAGAGTLDVQDIPEHIEVYVSNAEEVRAAKDGSVGAIEGLLRIEANADFPNQTDLIVDNSADTADVESYVTASQIVGLAPGTISYQAGSLANLTVYSGAGEDTINVPSIPPGARTSVYAGDGNDTVNVGVVPEPNLFNFGRDSGETSAANSTNESLAVYGEDGDDAINIETLAYFVPPTSNVDSGGSDIGDNVVVIDPDAIDGDYSTNSITTSVSSSTFYMTSSVGTNLDSGWSGIDLNTQENLGAIEVIEEIEVQVPPPPSSDTDTETPPTDESSDNEVVVIDVPDEIVDLPEVTIEPGHWTPIPIEVYGGNHNDVINVSPESKFLDHVKSHLTVDGGDDADTVNVNDQANPYDHERYTVTAGSVTRSYFGGLDYTEVEKLDLHTAAGNSTIDVKSTSAQSNVRINAGPGGDTINVGDDGNTLDGIQGTLSIHGMGGNDRLSLNDQGSGAGKTYRIYDSHVSRSGSADIHYNTVEKLVLNTGSQRDRFYIYGTDSHTPITINSGAGDDFAYVTYGYGSQSTLQGNVYFHGQRGARDYLYVSDWSASSGKSYWINSNRISRSGAANIYYYSTEITSLYTSRYDDAIKVYSTSYGTTTYLRSNLGDDTISLWSPYYLKGQLHVDGGSDIDTLDYSSFSTGVEVNLTTRTASYLSSLRNIENVNGGRGNDILVGDKLANELRGGAGKDMLIGGDGSDLLDGGYDDDLLIAGLTAYDMNRAALDALHSVWASAPKYTDAVTAIRKGMLVNGSTVRLDAKSVYDDGDQDQLTGSYGSDWFWASKYDTTDFNVYEDVLS